MLVRRRRWTLHRGTSATTTHRLHHWVWILDKYYWVWVLAKHHWIWILAKQYRIWV